MSIFLIADLHFGHRAIIEYENRPYNSVEKMDEDLILKWNNTVLNEDKIFVLGDFGFGNQENIIKIGNRLHGHKTLIIGNHDTMGFKTYLKCGFENVYSYPIIYENYWILSHDPMYINKNMPYANIFGHIHGNPAFKDYSEQTFCVSAERINYTPISFYEIKQKMHISDEGSKENI